MRYASTVLGLIGMAVTLAAAAQRNELPLGDLLALATEQMGIECERMLEPRSYSSDWAAREAEMRAAVYCDCMPPALADVARQRGLQSSITGEDFSALVLREFDICGARTVREAARRDCVKFTPPGAPPTYCTCFATAVDGLTDEQIVADSIAASENLERRQEARRNGTPEPPLLLSLLARIDSECRIPPPAR